MADGGAWDRRSVLRGAALLAGATAVAPLLGGTATARARGADADALFKAGEFDQAARAYEEILGTDPANLHAARRRGFIALLSNRFPAAEKYLTMAVELAPDDRQANQYLADCYIRQDKFALSAPHWKAAGNELNATWFAAVRGEPYQIHGDTTQVPWLQMDPFPLVEASVNGGSAKRFQFYTGAPALSLSASVAREAGVSAVARKQIDHLGGIAWRNVGVLASFEVGGMELRNVPVAWLESESGDDVDARSDGMIGMWVFYHLLPTFDYAGRSLILRRKTPETARKVRAAAVRAGTEPLPLYLAREHQTFSRGSIAGSGTRVLGVGFGGVGEIAAGLHGPAAELLDVRVDHDRPIETFAHSQPAVAYPCYPNELRLGDAVAENVYCYSDPHLPLSPHGFDVLGHFAHCFYKPYTVTTDFTDMNLYVTRGKAR
ncbi:aspartyl protease family protein [Nonomuraea sp. B10E15]|uniref:aspartyl protease family protein n=1 Tax=Nonomuraea sp. B10E15 TaxID=3153560 RepID=UPI00325F62A7